MGVAVLSRWGCLNSALDQSRAELVEEQNNQPPWNCKLDSLNLGSLLLRKHVRRRVPRSSTAMYLTHNGALATDILQYTCNPVSWVTKLALIGPVHLSHSGDW